MGYRKRIVVRNNYCKWYLDVQVWPQMVVSTSQSSPTNQIQSLRLGMTLTSFQVKTPDLLIWDSWVVMSRTEEPLFDELFRLLPRRTYGRVLEVGFGLGISAEIIQTVLQPKSHDIVELHTEIIPDLKRFAHKTAGVRAIVGDFWNFPPPCKYDFIFYDPFEYGGNESEVEEVGPAYYDDKAERLLELLAPNGVVCCPLFGDQEVFSLNGLKRTKLKRLKVHPYYLYDGTLTTDGGFACYSPE